jgi:mono/diheme cytochrome c family protein
MRLFLAGLLCAALTATAVSGQRAGQTKPADSREAGAQAFRTYCAPCHGTAARGDGPMAQQLRTPPPDLTKYTARNRGVFPREQLRRIIDGSDVAAHGTREMPVWGDAFRAAREGLSPKAAQARIEAVITYLESIQEQPAE